MSAVQGGLAVNGTLLVVGAAASMQVSPLLLLMGCRSIKGWYSGTSIDSEDTLAFSARTGVRSMNETFPLERVTEAYDRMMSGKARFRVVLTIGRSRAGATEPGSAPDRGGRTAFRSSRSHRPPRQVSWLVIYLNDVHCLIDDCVFLSGWRTRGMLKHEVQVVTLKTVSSAYGPERLRLLRTGTGFYAGQ